MGINKVCKYNFQSSFAGWLFFGLTFSVIAQATKENSNKTGSGSHFNNLLFFSAVSARPIFSCCQFFFLLQPCLFWLAFVFLALSMLLLPTHSFFLSPVVCYPTGCVLA